MPKISNLKLSGELFLAPMAGYTNIAFRTLAREYGAALVYTELVSAKSILTKNRNTTKLLGVSEKEKPIFLQLFGNNLADFGKAVSFIEKNFGENFAGFDLNAGCSAPKAVKGKYGSFLMNDAKNVGRIIASMKNATNKPVTIKMRLGYKEENFLDVASEAIKNGVSAVTLHPRLGIQKYAGEANWSKINQLSELTRERGVKLIGNGDIKSIIDTKKMKGETNCDFEMIGRSAMGNAFFFSQANKLLGGKKVPTKTFSETKKEGSRFLELVKEFGLGANDARPYLIGLSKGLIGASVLRNRFALTKSLEEMEQIFFAYFE